MRPCGTRSRQQPVATPAEVAVARAVAYAQQTSRLRETTRDTLIAYFLAGQFRDADVALFLARAVPLVLSSRRRMASLTAAHIERVLRDVGLAPDRPIAIPDVSLLRGVAATDVYQRPFQQVWTELSQDKDFQAAVKVGETRVAKLIETDLQLAKTHAAQAVMSKANGSGFYQRVLKGEHDCIKCVLTSTRVYSKAELLPIHPGCDCDVEPIVGLAQFKTDAARRLADAHDMVAAQFGPDAANATGKGYSDLIVTHHHGEYGPTLGVRGQQFTGPAAI
jgi:hypothetical protein